MRLINVHCHVLNFKSIPDSFFRTRLPFRENIIRIPWVGSLVNFFFRKVWPGTKYDLIKEQLELLGLSIDEVAKQLIDEMDEAQIDLAIPLMMDMETPKFDESPEHPCNFQAEYLADICVKQHFGRLIPFIMFDPRKPQAASLCIRCLEEFGFLGVKIYPTLGFHPSHKSICNNSYENKELTILYEYCNAHRIPITAHCSPGGAYSFDLVRGEQVRYYFTRPEAWLEVLKSYPRLRLNLAHFGGNITVLDQPTLNWGTRKVIQMIRDFDNVYADIAYHDEAQDVANVHGRQTEYFKSFARIVEEEKVRSRVIFGTDWPMTRHTWTERMYCDSFRSHLSNDLMQSIGFANPLDFLFHNRIIPSRLIDFWQQHNKSHADLPDSIREATRSS